MPDTVTPTYIAIVCPLCNEVRYRSSRPFVQGDRPSPADFVPENGAPEAAITDTIPMCHECGAAMEPRLDPTGATVGGGVTVAPPAVNRTERVRNLPSQPVQTLFTPDPGETILHVVAGTNALMVATSKRVVKVNL